MKKINVSVVSATAFKMPAETWTDEEDGIEYIEIDENEISQCYFEKIRSGTTLEIFINGVSSGNYTMICRADGKIVLGKGNLEKILNNR